LPPAPAYFVLAFESTIAGPWRAEIPELLTEMRRAHGPAGDCTMAGRCEGHFWGESLARAVMRMLYLTLPARGHMPFSKRDVVAYATQVCGEEVKVPLMAAIDIARKGRPIYHDEYLLILPFARRLWHETLSLQPDRAEAARFLCQLRQVFADIASRRKRTGR
jgi:hypothetical protein